MNYTYMLLEIYCLAKKEDISPCCKWGKGKIGLHCISDHCQYCGYCEAENEIALTDVRGIVNHNTDHIGFGGEMDLSKTEEERKILLNKWYKICRKKIKESYTEYMENHTHFL